MIFQVDSKEKKKKKGEERKIFATQRIHINSTAYDKVVMPTELRRPSIVQVVQPILAGIEDEVPIVPSYQTQSV